MCRCIYPDNAAQSLTACPLTQTTTPTSSQVPGTTPYDPGSTISTVYTTITYTITSCPLTVVDCPIGQVTTDTISVYTTVCPAEPTGAPQNPEPLVVVGILVTVIIDITVVIHINGDVTGKCLSLNSKRKLTAYSETSYFTTTLTSDQTHLYNQATQDQRMYSRPKYSITTNCLILIACYVCQLSSQGVGVPSSDVTVTRVCFSTRSDKFLT